MKTAQDLVLEAKKNVNEITIDQAELAIKDADVLIDVREPDEFLAGHLQGAVNIPRGLLEFKLSNTPELEPRDMHIVLYCKTSGRAALSADSLHKMGYLNVHSIAGGYDAWVEAAKPTVTPVLPEFD